MCVFRGREIERERERDGWEGDSGERDKGWEPERERRVGGRQITSIDGGTEYNLCYIVKGITRSELGFFQKPVSCE